MAADEIDTFMRAIQGNESAAFDDPANVVNQDTGAHGHFQILPRNWRGWAQEAGLGADAPKTSENQTKVARNKMLDYYDKFGSWDAVAVAWFAGPGRARRYVQGDKSVLELDDGNATVGEYIDKMQQGMNGTQPRLNAGIESSMSAFQRDTGTQGQQLNPGIESSMSTFRESAGVDGTDPAEMWRTILDTLADSTAGGEREELPEDEGLQPDNETLGAASAGFDGGEADAALSETVNRWLPEGPSEDEIGDAEPIEGADAPDLSDEDLPELGDVTPGQDGVPAGLKTNAARGAAAARKILGFDGEIGGVGERANKSDHPDGNAIDIMTGGDIERGQEIAEWYVRNRDKLGVKYVIFNRTIWSAKNDWKPRRMEDRGSPTANHVDHPHISFT